MLVIIHGWSDEAKSFANLAKKLAQPAPAGIGADIAEIHLGDYLSLDDHITFNDLVAAMDKAWNDRGLSRAPRSHDVVVHSTGGLVIRDWMTHFFAPAAIPVKRLLMLAPANFGSPLAHTGRSVLGRAAKGWGGTHLFETGAHILKGLELASPYSWALSERDLFSNQKYYGPQRILCTVLVGNTGYSGISALANKPGSDGTVRVSTANLNAARLTLDFTGDPQTAVAISAAKDVNATAFGILDGENHSTAAAKDRGPQHAANWQLICAALRVDDDTFGNWQKRLQQHNDTVTRDCEQNRGDYFHSYQNTVVRVVDNHGASVNDYVLEFYVNDDKNARDRKLTQKLQEEVISNVHAYGDNKAYRSLLINCTQLHKLLEKDSDRVNLSITATPELARGKVGYRTYSDKDIGALSLDARKLAAVFQGHRTLLITLTLQRYQHDEVFRFKDV